MNIPGKELWYDWNGLNRSFFEQVNGIRGGSYYDRAMITLSEIANHHHFYYYLIGLAAFALITTVIRMLQDRGGVPHYLAAWGGILLVLAASYVTEGCIIRYAKDYFNFPRPYMVLAHTTRVLMAIPPEDNYHSFPSGHAAFITMMVVGLWPMLSINLRWLGVALIAGVCWSRLAVGAHFPADVATSVIVFLPMTILIRAIIYRILRSFGIRC